MADATADNDRRQSDEIIRDDDAETNLTSIQEILNFLQSCTGPTSTFPDIADEKEDEENVRKLTVKAIIEILSLNLPVLYDEIEDSDTESFSDSSSNYSSDDEDDVYEIEGSGIGKTWEFSLLSSSSDPDAENEKNQIVQDEKSSSSSIFKSASCERSQELESVNKASIDASNSSKNSIQQNSDQVAVISPSSSNSQAIISPQKRDELIWNAFVVAHKSGNVNVNQFIEDDDEEFICQYYDSSSDESESESDVDEELATFPFMDSDSESSDGQKLNFNVNKKATSLTADAEFDIITIDDDDEVDVVGEEMLCGRCPPGKGKFEDISVFLLHRERHVGKHHFLCPTCLKPFTKFSFCLSHEIRIHEESFAFDNPVVSLANEFKKNKQEQNNDTKNCTASSSNAHEPIPEINIPEEALSEFSLNNYEADYETDEDDPKFYPDYAVPSTTLYPYRGPKVQSIFEAYAVQLKFGRKKRTAINTTARLALNHREKLREKGQLPETAHRFSKAQNDSTRKNKWAGVDDYFETDSSVQSQPSEKRKKRYIDDGNPSSSSSAHNPPRRKRQRASELKKASKLSSRTFASSVMSRTCLLCLFTWNTEAELRAHREEKHPKKKLVELMTVISKKAAKKIYDSEDSDAIYIDVGRKSKKRKRNHAENFHQGMTKESFLACLGLISVRKLALRKKNKTMCKPFSIKLKRLNQGLLPRSGRVFLCNLCKHFDKSRDLINLHKKRRHGTGTVSVKSKELKSRPKHFFFK